MPFLATASDRLTLYSGEGLVLRIEEGGIQVWEGSDEHIALARAELDRVNQRYIVTGYLEQALQEMQALSRRAVPALPSLSSVERHLGDQLGLMAVPGETVEAFRERIRRAIAIPANFGSPYGLDRGVSMGANIVANPPPGFLPREGETDSQFRERALQDVRDQADRFSFTEVSFVENPPDPNARIRQTVPFFEVGASGPSIDLNEVRRRRFNSPTRFPSWFVMGSWVRHIGCGICAQLIDAENETTGVLEIWEHHEHRLGWDPMWGEYVEVSPEGYLHVTRQGVYGHWEPCEEPVLPPTIWEHLDDEIEETV